MCTCRAAADGGKLLQLGRHGLASLLQDLHKRLGQAAVSSGKEGVGRPTGARTARAPYPVDVVFGAMCHIIVDDALDVLHICGGT